MRLDGYTKSGLVSRVPMRRSVSSEGAHADLSTLKR